MSLYAHAVAHNLRVDHDTATVLRELAAVDVHPILLKGPSTSKWLYRNDPRQYQDTDLLVAPWMLERAERMLTSAGYEPAVVRSAMPSWWQDHGIEWTNPERFAAVDLHQTIKGLTTDPERVWMVLSSSTESMVVGGHEASVLNRTARLFVVALDRIGDANDDLNRALLAARREDWEGALEIASALGAEREFATGLGLAPGGGEMVHSLGIEGETTVEMVLRSDRPVAGAVTIDRLLNARGLRERWSIIRYKLVPPETFVRHWSPSGINAPKTLPAMYLRRVFWVLTRVPSAFAGWRRATRSLHRKRSEKT